MSEELTKTKLLPIQGKDMDSIMQNLETGVAELFTSERYQEYLKTMSKFHNYSFNNTLLIAMQRPDATLVTGYRNWQSMGRQVKKGEKGITIIAPAPIKRKKTSIPVGCMSLLVDHSWGLHFSKGYAKCAQAF